MKPQSYNVQFTPLLKKYLILNGKELYIREFKCNDDAKTWAEHHHSLEIIVRDFENLNQI